MITVYKYVLWFVGDYCELDMPLDSAIVHVDYGVQGGGDICIWVLVNTEQTDIRRRKFRIAGTGHPLDKNCRHLGSLKGIEGPFIWHIFEVYDN